jgi:membrane-bound lytic murein transglycosylase D
MNSIFQNKSIIIYTLFLMQFLSSCSHVQMTSHAELNRKREQGYVPANNIENTEQLESADLDEMEALSLDDEVPAEKSRFNPLNLFQRNQSAQAATPSKPTGPQLELTYLDEHFDFWVNYFINRDKERFERHLTNGEAFREIVAKVFQEHGLPEELFYVGLIESGYNMHIRSHAAAVGPWQFIKGTATRYGMRVNDQIDERTNIHKASVAAAGYFRDLYNIFGSWELALCAYNAGEYRIINAIRKGNTRDYTELVRKKLIPRETIYYVPKVAAARYLSDNRSKYKINVNPIKDNFYIKASEVVVNGTFTLDDVGNKIGVTSADMKKLNPDFKHAIMSAPRTGQRVIVPNTKLAQAQGMTFTHRRAVAQSAASENTDTGTYRVQRGDNLSKIASKHKTTVANLRSLNNIRGSRILVGQTLRVPASSQVRTYRVRRGDNLTIIAQRFNTTVPRLVEMNSLSGTRIFPNQMINIPGDS